jgi:hypothetical protein
MPPRIGGGFTTPDPTSDSPEMGVIRETRGDHHELRAREPAANNLRSSVAPGGWLILMSA